MCVFIEDEKEMIFIDDDGDLEFEDLEFLMNSPSEDEYLDQIEDEGQNVEI